MTFVLNFSLDGRTPWLEAFLSATHFFASMHHRVIVESYVQQSPGGSTIYEKGFLIGLIGGA